MAGSFPDRREDGFDVDGERAVIIVVRDFLHGAAGEYAGVVHEDIEPAEALGHRFHQRRNFGRVSSVSLECVALPAVLANGGNNGSGGIRRCGIADCGIGAFRREPFGEQRLYLCCRP
jgi:hypothetical protein